MGDLHERHARHPTSPEPAGERRQLGITGVQRGERAVLDHDTDGVVVLGIVDVRRTEDAYAHRPQ